MTSTNSTLEGLPTDLVLACSRFSRLAARRADVGVSSVTWRITATLARFGEMRVSELATREQVSRPTTTATLKRLEEEGLIVRRADPDDARSTFVSLTLYGRQRLSQWYVALDASVEGLISDFPADDRAVLARAAEILARTVDSAEGDPTAL
ncbi:MAG TPA: MarR family transcriptional regulator [Candidatus Nesterenkonia stercoripullorum]|uniref:MarR family transcriptional regulator n=1 Tax=Candidatus Nesterenkonia stercoripullorum TaxID=2838701 RepID=A0A9D1RZQ5_9MICC|nr:MarR family transcriptional regulator [Candidatus Nesterenkonia stercoripullorum]